MFYKDRALPEAAGSVGIQVVAERGFDCRICGPRTLGVCSGPSSDLAGTPARAHLALGLHLLTLGQHQAC